MNVCDKFGGWIAKLVFIKEFTFAFRAFFELEIRAVKEGDRLQQDHQDEEFLGVISGVTDWGIYIEIISNKCEGMVSVRDMKDDHYQFDQDQYAMVGRKTKTMYQLGDEVIVKVKNTDLVKKHLDFYMVGKPEA